MYQINTILHLLNLMAMGVSPALLNCNIQLKTTELHPYAYMIHIFPWAAPTATMTTGLMALLNLFKILIRKIAMQL